MGRKKNPEPISSGDQVVDWLFNQVVYFLKRKSTIYKVKDLRDPDDRRHRLTGYIISCGNRHKIWIEGLTCIHVKQRTVFHEGLHAFMRVEEELGKRGIETLEEILWPRLSRSQQEVFKKYIPKHYVFKRPEDEDE